MEKIKGWVAWHPVEGGALITASISRQWCEDRLLKNYFKFDYRIDVFAKAEAYYAARDIELIRASNDGWQIRPVELRFTDEEEKEK